MYCISSDFVFTGYGEIQAGKMLVCNEEGVLVEIVEETKSVKGISRRLHYQGLLCPGFVNAHCHSELSSMKDKIPSGLGLSHFIASLEKEKNQQQGSAKETMVSEGLRQMWLSGIVAIGDVCNTADSLKSKLLSDLQCRNFIEMYGSDASKADVKFEKALQLEKLFNESGQIHTSVSPHALYSVSLPLLEKILSYCVEKNQVISLHFLESAEEPDYLEHGRGRFAEWLQMQGIAMPSHLPLQDGILSFIERLFPDDIRMLLVHNTFADGKTVEHLAGLFARLHFCLCPSSNLYIENRLPDIPVFCRYSERVCLGTDSLASNTTLNMLEEIKLLISHYPETEHEIFLQWATRNGAKALGFDNDLGELTEGKTPGLVAVFPVGEKGEILPDSSSRLVFPGRIKQ